MKVFSVILILVLAISCKTETVQKKVSMKEDVYYLADDKLEGRETGTFKEKEAATYIANRFKDIGLEPAGTKGYFQEFSFKPKTNPHDTPKIVTKNNDSTITGVNVVGFLDNKAAHTIIIGAHYDHLGHGIEGTLYRGDDKPIHNGADDNASGVAVMMNLAQKLKAKNTHNNYLFIAFSGEEMGLLGSNYFAKNPTKELAKVNYMLNMDMVGRLKKDSTLAVYGVGTSPIFKQVVQANNQDFKIIEKESGVGPSDHTSFYLVDVPVLHFFTGQHADYHKPTDDADKLNYEGMEKISGYIFNIISDLDNNGKLPFRKTKNESEDTPAFKVTLGVVPDYMYDKAGMRIDGVSDDRPAQKAGMKKGDIVIKVGDYEIVDMMSYMKALSKFEKGQKTTVVILRAGKEIPLDVVW
jgi:Zn-dependent M28 family amino/carboxypeptidase